MKNASAEIMEPPDGTNGRRKQRKMAGTLTQTKIILWKNLLLYKQNKLGIFFELLFLSFALILTLLAYYSFEEVHQSSEKSEKTLTIEFPQTVYFYPDSKFVEYLLKKSAAMASSNRVVNFIGASHSTPEGFNSSQLKNIQLFVSFPTSYDSFQDIHDSFNYTIFTIE
jgi:hypothetical protein